jgi:general secretion pathway protein G
MSSQSKVPDLTTVLSLISLSVILAFGFWIRTNYLFCFCAGATDVAATFVTTTIETPLLAYRQTNGSFPYTWPGLIALIHQPAGVVGWKGPYITTQTVPLDPWNTPYHYRFPGVHNSGKYDCWSSGPDKVDDTPDDIGNW